MELKPRDIYLDCSYHPVLCTESDGVDVAGISLVNGSRPRSCSIKHCGLRKLTIKETLEILDIWADGGLEAILVHFGWVPEQAESFSKDFSP